MRIESYLCALAPLCRRFSPRIGVYLRLSAAAFLLAAGDPGLAVAQGKVNAEDLKVRAEAGDKNATRRLAEIYYLGRDGVEQNYKEAARWYEKLARQGDPRAQTSLGLMYARGYGVEKDLESARKWWSFAAAQNDPGAQYNLGLLYYRGEGVRQDYAQAARWLGEAARRGHVPAQHNLGMLYFDGRGVERDAVRAYFWVKVAALQGDETSERSLKLVARGMSDDQLAQANAQADEWMRRNAKVLK